MMRQGIDLGFEHLGPRPGSCRLRLHQHEAVFVREPVHRERQLLADRDAGGGASVKCAAKRNRDVRKALCKAGDEIDACRVGLRCETRCRCQRCVGEAQTTGRIDHPDTGHGAGRGRFQRRGHYVPLNGLHVFAL